MTDKIHVRVHPWSAGDKPFDVFLSAAEAVILQNSNNEEISINGRRFRVQVVLVTLSTPPVAQSGVTLELRGSFLAD